MESGAEHRVDDAAAWKPPEARSYQGTFRRIAVVVTAVAAALLLFAQMIASSYKPGAHHDGSSTKSSFANPSSLLVVLPSFLPQRQKALQHSTDRLASRDAHSRNAAVQAGDRLLSSLVHTARSSQHLNRADKYLLGQIAKEKALIAKMSDGQDLSKQKSEPARVGKTLRKAVDIEEGSRRNARISTLKALKIAEAKETQLKKKLADLSSDMFKQLADTGHQLRAQGAISEGADRKADTAAVDAKASSVDNRATVTLVRSIASGESSARAPSGDGRMQGHDVANQKSRHSKATLDLARTLHTWLHGKGGSRFVRSKRHPMHFNSRGRDKGVGHAHVAEQNEVKREDLNKTLHQWAHREKWADFAQEQHTEIAFVDHKLKMSTLKEQDGERAKKGWGLFNPENGVIRVDCGDTVADGGGGTSKALKDRFWGPVGTRYTVECPPLCGKFDTTVYGCGTFLDGSAICKAAMMEGKVGYDSGGYVEVELVDPIPEYRGCAATAFSEVPVPAHRDVRQLTFTSMPFQWYSWRQAEKLSKISKYGEEGAIIKYRTSCHDKADMDCFGRRAFRLDTADMEFVPPPRVQPPSGEHLGRVLVSISAPTCVQQVRYTLDGSEPTMTSMRYELPFYITAGGTTTLRAISYSEERAPYLSDDVSEVYTIIPAAPPPLISPEGARVELIIGKDNITMIPQEEGDQIFFTTDGNEPTDASEVYTLPIPVTSTLVGPGRTLTVKAIEISANETLMPSPITTTSYTAIQACPEPLFSPPSGAVLVPLEGDRVVISCQGSCRAFFTEDGSLPTRASRQALGPLRMNPGDYTLKASCMGEGFATSDVVEADFEIRVRSSAPTFSPKHLYTEDPTAQVLISPATIGSKILFTVDGSLPLEGSPTTYACGSDIMPSTQNVSEVPVTARRLMSVREVGKVEEPGEEDMPNGAYTDQVARGRLSRGEVPLGTVERLLKYGGPSYWRGPVSEDDLVEAKKPHVLKDPQDHDAPSGSVSRGEAEEEPSLGIDRLRNNGQRLVVTEPDVRPLTSLKSEVTVDGCLLMLDSGTYHFHAIAIAPGRPCISCPTFAPSRVVVSGKYDIDPPPPPTDESRPILTFFRNGGEEMGEGKNEEPDEAGVVLLNPTDRLYAQLECPDKGAQPRYTIDNEEVTHSSYVRSELRLGQAARFAVPSGSHVLRAACYRGIRLLSTELDETLLIIQKPMEPICENNDAVFHDVESVVVRLDMRRGQGELRYKIATSDGISHGKEETCPEVGRERQCNIFLSATACHETNSSLADLSRDAEDEMTPGARRRLRSTNILSSVPPPPCVYHISAYVDGGGLALSTVSKCRYTIQAPAISSPPTLSMKGGVYEVNEGGSLPLYINCGTSENGTPRVGIDKDATRSSPVLTVHRLRPGTTTVNALCWSSEPLTYPSPVVSAVFVVKEQAPMVECSKGAKGIFTGEDSGVQLLLTDRSQSLISYSLAPLGGETKPDSTKLHCGEPVCHVFLPSFCDHPMQKDDKETEKEFGKYYPEGCAYQLHAWAESELRARSPVFVGTYLVVPNPVAQAPIFSEAILGGGQEVSPNHYLLEPGSSVSVQMTCPTPGTEPRHAIGRNVDLRANDQTQKAAFNRFILEDGTHLYTARCFGPNARSSPIASQSYTVQVKALPPEASAPSNTEFLGGPGQEPVVRLFLEGDNARGQIHWTKSGEGMNKQSGVCSGTEESCLVYLYAPTCEPWLHGKTSCEATIIAKTVMSGALDSAPVTWTYLITPPPPVAPPTFDPDPGSGPSGLYTFVEAYGLGVKVNIMCHAGAVPRYTLDGRIPTRYSTVYTGPVTIQRGVTDLQAICIRDGLIGGSGVSHAKFRVVSDSPVDNEVYDVSNRAPPPRSNPPTGSILDATALTALELVSARELGDSDITYFTVSHDGVRSNAVTCDPLKHCEVPLPTSCGDLSQAALLPSHAQNAVTCNWSVTATENVPNGERENILSSLPVTFNFTLYFPAKAAPPVFSPGLMHLQGDGHAASADQHNPLIVNYGGTYTVKVTCPTANTVARFVIGASVTVNSQSPQVPASGEIEISSGLHIVHAQCDSANGDKHMLASDVTEGSYYVMQRVPSPVPQPATGHIFSRVFSASVLILDTYEEATVTYKVAGEAPHKCTGSQCIVTLSSTCPGSSEDSNYTAEGSAEQCSFTITATASARGYAKSLPATFHYTLTPPKFAQAPTFRPEPPARGNVTIIGYMQTLPVALVCDDPGAIPFYVITPDDLEEKPEVTQYSTKFSGAIQVEPKTAPSTSVGEEGIGHMDGVTNIHAICYSPSLRPSKVVTARYVVIERAPSPSFSPDSGTIFPWNGGEPLRIQIVDALPETDIKYSLDGGEWSQCDDMPETPGQGVHTIGDELCRVTLPFSCDGVPHNKIDEDGFTTCTFGLRAIATGEGMADSEVEHASFAIRIPPPLSLPEFSPDPTEQHVIEAGSNTGLDVSIFCPLGEAHYSLNDDFQQPTHFSPKWTPGSLRLPTGRHVVSAICYLEGRKQQSNPVTVEYNVVARAPMPVAEPTSGTALAADGGTVSVLLIVPLSEASIVFSVNGGDTAICGSHEECRIDLPVECPTKVRDMNAPQRDVGGAQGQSSAKVQQRRLLSEKANTTILQEAPVCQYQIVALSSAPGFVDSHAATFDYTVADTDVINEYSDNVIETHSSTWTNKGLNVDIDSIHMSGYPSIAFDEDKPIRWPITTGVFDKTTPVKFSKDTPVVIGHQPPPVIHSGPGVVAPEPPPEITPPLPVNINEKPPEYGPHKFGGTYKQLDHGVVLGLPKNSQLPLTQQRLAVLHALARQANVESKKAKAVKQKVERVGVRVRQELARIKDLNTRGLKDHREMEKVLQQERHQVSALDAERSALKDRSKILGKYQRLSGLRLQDKK